MCECVSTRERECVCVRECVLDIGVRAHFSRILSWKSIFAIKPCYDLASTFQILFKTSFQACLQKCLFVIDNKVLQLRCKIKIEANSSLKSAFAFLDQAWLIAFGKISTVIDGLMGWRSCWPLCPKGYVWVQSSTQLAFATNYNNDYVSGMMLELDEYAALVIPGLFPHSA